MSVVSLDMNIGNLLTRQIQPGMSAHNSISVTRNTKVGDAGGTISTYGLFFNLALNRAEGMHAAVRNLIELSTIEVLGKLAEVPYWRCLQIEQTNPAVEATARAWFNDMSEREQIVFVQRALASQGLYDAPITGVRDEIDQGRDRTLPGRQRPARRRPDQLRPLRQPDPRGPGARPPARPELRPDRRGRGESGRTR